MSEVDRSKYLRIVLVLVGLTFTFGIWPLTIVWPSGWSWHTEGRSYSLEMILAIYATLGVFLILAARNPSHTGASSGSPSGLASSTAELWLCSRLTAITIWGTSGVTFSLCSP